MEENIGYIIGAFAIGLPLTMGVRWLRRLTLSRYRREYEENRSFFSKMGGWLITWFWVSVLVGLLMKAIAESS